MTYEEAIKSLPDDTTVDKCGIRSPDQYIYFDYSDDEGIVTLDGNFTLKNLEAIAYLMSHHPPTSTNADPE